MDKDVRGYQALLQIRLLDGRLFQKPWARNQMPNTEVNRENFNDFVETKTWGATATDIALATGLANNTLTSMVKKLEEQGLVMIQTLYAG